VPIRIPLFKNEIRARESGSLRHGGNHAATCQGCP